MLDGITRQTLPSRFARNSNVLIATTVEAPVCKRIRLRHVLRSAVGCEPARCGGAIGRVVDVDPASTEFDAPADADEFAVGPP